MATYYLDMSTRLAELSFTEYRRKALGLLLLHPDQAYHVREIARLTGTVAGTLHKELSKLADAGVLVKQTSGNQVLYQANPVCPIYQELSGVVKKTFALGWWACSGGVYGLGCGFPILR